MKILHFSDIHLLTPFVGVPFREWLGKRLVGRLNLSLRRRRAFAAGPEKVRALADLAERVEVDAVVFTGDYSTLGTDVELETARRAVEPLMGRPAGYVNVPGNHDLYLADTVRSGRFERTFGDVLWSDLPDRCVDGPWPLVRLLDDRTAILAINSARPNPRPWRSSGAIPDAQLRALASLAELPEIRDRLVFVATHYAPRLADGRPDRRSHGLDNAEGLLQVLAELPTAVLLHGHVHHCYALTLADSGLAVFNAGSATYEGREGCWVFDVQEERLLAMRGRWEAGAWALPDPPLEIPLTPR